MFLNQYHQIILKNAFNSYAFFIFNEMIVMPANETKIAAQKAASKKTSLKKNTLRKKESTIKYSDKSKDQPELIPIFTQIKNILKNYQKGSLKENSDSAGQYHICSLKEIEVAGRKYEHMYFASAMVQKGFVGFYFMPVYANPELKEKLPAGLLKCLKGKSCFHIKKNDPLIMQQIKLALDIGLKCYEEKGWI